MHFQELRDGPCWGARTLGLIPGPVLLLLDMGGSGEGHVTAFSGAFEPAPCLGDRGVQANHGTTQVCGLQQAPAPLWVSFLP